jgi:hypothetical protein
MFTIIRLRVEFPSAAASNYTEVPGTTETRLQVADEMPVFNAFTPTWFSAPET